MTRSIELLAAISRQLAGAQEDLAIWWEECAPSEFPPLRQGSWYTYLSNLQNIVGKRIQLEVEEQVIQVELTQEDIRTVKRSLDGFSVPISEAKRVREKLPS